MSSRVDFLLSISKRGIYRALKYSYKIEYKRSGEMPAASSDREPISFSVVAVCGRPRCSYSHLNSGAQIFISERERITVHRV